MSLSKKHYEGFAKLFARHNAKAEMVEDFIDYFREDNPLFEGGRFWEAIKKEKKLKKVV
jgi:hypothetical protein